MIRLIKKKAKSIVCSVLAAVTLFTMNPAVFATETATQTDTVSSVDVSGSDSSDAADKSNTDSNADSTTTAGSEANDKVTISKNDKPYLSLGADLTPDQRATVLGFMGIELTDLDNYDVVYVIMMRSTSTSIHTSARARLAQGHFPQYSLQRIKRVRVLVFPRTISITVR